MQENNGGTKKQQELMQSLTDRLSKVNDKLAQVNSRIGTLRTSESELRGEKCAVMFQNERK